MEFKLVRSVVAFTVIAAAVSGLSAQQGRGGAPAAPQPPQSPQAAAPIDVTGYWVAIVNEDWRWRMVTPPKGDVASVPLNAEGRKLAEAWDPKTDGSCLAYGAGGLMRIPTRLHITWEGENVLKIETDAGQQTRRLLFDKSTAKPAQRSLQGFSIAEWERPAARGFGGGGGFGPGGGAGAGAPPAPPAAAPDAGAAAGRGGRGGRAAGPPAARTGDLKVVTTNLSAAWLRKNGVPYSEDATITEYFDRFPTPGGDEWLVVTTVVADAKYLNTDFVTSTHFRREPNAAKWDPAPCKAAP
jgi:hypothetical protein